MVDASRGFTAAELPEAFWQMHEETMNCWRGGNPPRFRIFIRGQRKGLHPVVSDEVYRIGREAVINALRHSRAKNIEIEVNYCSKSLRLIVRDDGCGIEPQLSAAGCNGHRGLS